MAHWSENAERLEITQSFSPSLKQLANSEYTSPDVFLLRLPFVQSGKNNYISQKACKRLAWFCRTLHEQSVVCIFAPPRDAAMLLPYLTESLQYQLWISVRSVVDNAESESSLPSNHAALLVLTRYRGSLRHTTTRIAYTYCPSCRKTTKDYGGKKHTYHEYGTLISDVWRDFEIQPQGDLGQLTDRIADLFGLAPHRRLHVINLQKARRLREDLCSKAPTNMLPMHRSGLKEGLIKDDCLTALGRIPNNSIDFCFADPPYNLKKKYANWDDALESVEYFDWCDEWLSELYRVLKPGRSLAVLNIPLWSARHFQHLADFAHFQNWIAWDSLSFPVRKIMPAHYAVICFSKGFPRELPFYDEVAIECLDDRYCSRSTCVANRKRLEDRDRSPVTDLWTDIHRLKHNSRRVDHPCQLPPTLMKRLYETFTYPGEVILDCFNGAGTSTLVAEQTKRKYIGIELSDEYHHIAETRHKNLRLGVDPFGKVESVPTAKNSRVARMPKRRYEVSKKELQLEIRRIAQELNKLPTKDDVRRNSPYPFHYFEDYFVSWGEACAAARTTGMSEECSLAINLAQYRLFDS